MKFNIKKKILPISMDEGNGTFILVPKKFNELTAQEKAEVCNGCGGKGSWIPVPEFIFHASCNHHDYNYTLGGDEADRLKADDQFYTDMKRAVKKAKWWKRAFYSVWAKLYYKGVRKCGHKYFNYATESS